MAFRLFLKVLAKTVPADYILPFDELYDIFCKFIGKVVDYDSFVQQFINNNIEIYHTRLYEDLLAEGKIKDLTEFNLTQEETRLANYLRRKLKKIPIHEAIECSKKYYTPDIVRKFIDKTINPIVTVTMKAIIAASHDQLSQRN